MVVPVLAIMVALPVAAKTRDVGKAEGEHVVISDKMRCKSKATPLSIDVPDASGKEFLELLSQVSGLPIAADRDLSRVRVAARVEGLAWDCLLKRFARQVDLRVVVSESGVRLVERRK